ncbi:hypothetical protein UFOVP245_45 [uncultured Caudovirales phage]|uniref:Uncharacterized protein n=1 Tax=uncultured Caudovirales phage TaxID=2100421 RepID=A0A6J7WW47_9CAUD|nr:hypothetical protein UFOVP245_45 [uncultured Caudovirales phage]
MSIDFCHIAPTPHLGLTNGRPVHLVLAHLVEQDASYVDFYLQQKDKYKCKLILDNSAFEMFKQGKPMYDSSKLIEMGNRINADWIVMSDYPGEPGEKTIEAAKKLAPEFHSAGFGTFFVPQSKVGDVDDVIDTFRWASHNTDLVDYIGVSILTAPNAYGVEKGNKMQRFVSRLKLMYEMKEQMIFPTLKAKGTRVHYLGMVDGPNEIMYMEPFGKYIDTWDSSAAVWAGLNGISFDRSPTGLINGKFEEEVDFNFKTDDTAKLDLAKANMEYIDKLSYAYIWK